MGIVFGNFSLRHTVIDRKQERNITLIRIPSGCNSMEMNIYIHETVSMLYCLSALIGCLRKYYYHLSIATRRLARGSRAVFFIAAKASLPLLLLFVSYHILSGYKLQHDRVHTGCFSFGIYLRTPSEVIPSVPYHIPDGCIVDSWFYCNSEVP